MNLCNPEVYDRRFDELEAKFTRPRTERSILNMTGRATTARLKQLEAEEMRALRAIQDYSMKRRTPHSP
jgi:hypothetical protein